jgi:hypothetical protein
MPLTVGSATDAALQPAAAASRPTEIGVAAAKKALDHQEVQGRAAVQLIEAADTSASSADAGDRDAKGRNVDRRA